ncbi:MULTISPECIES: HPr kinase/phosphatase C-terminal domain-containing protein [unclassified Rhizobium]|uniref:HPr kinase/phosphorylase n=1 Tax=unclassified Rhizobium TaxID=2613769 RepID=UPI0006F3202E|nr:MULTISPECIES: HPr kinase/phosphatase C-terminal domain-containing protein [unclassified Rhizobium]KQV35863.1 serine kinase [Rhizobium sp. Root1212]KRD25969.1 serine kinase [Rhizobium sp. Root268]
MTGAAGTNVHATAVVIESRCLLFIGPSGSGKSSVALACLMAARDHGLFAALVADDQVFVSTVNGRIIARRPSSIAGLAELRGAGIVPVASLQSAVLDYAILPVSPPFKERVPPETERHVLPDGNALPLLRLPLMAGLRPFDTLRLLLAKTAVISQ